MLCKAVEISKSTYYRLRNKPSTEDKHLKLILNIFNESHQTYGHRRIAIALREKYNIIINKKKVARLMKEHNIIPAYYKKKTKYKNKTSIDAGKKPNLVEKHFIVTKPNQVWVTDVCTLYYKEKRRYFSVMLDLYDRKIISYKISENNDAELATQTLITAKWNRLDSQNVIIHSDQGSPYFSESFQLQCRLWGFQQSMSRRGRPTDNAVMESFFSRYRAEIKGFPKPKSIDDVKRNAFDWVWFYDKDRISLPKKIKKRKIFNYDKAIGKAKEFEMLKMKKVKLD